MVRAHHHPKRTGQVALVGIAGAQTPAAVDALAALFQTLRRAVGRNAQLLQHIFQCGLTDEVACVLLTQALHSRPLVASVVPQKHQRLAGKAAYLGQELDAVHVLQSAAQHQNVHIALLEPFQQRPAVAVARTADGRVALLKIACPYPHLSGVIAGQSYAPYDVLFLITHTTRPLPAGFLPAPPADTSRK